MTDDRSVDGRAVSLREYAGGVARLVMTTGTPPLDFVQPNRDRTPVQATRRTASSSAPRASTLAARRALDRRRQAAAARMLATCGIPCRPRDSAPSASLPSRSTTRRGRRRPRSPRPATSSTPPRTGSTWRHPQRPVLRPGAPPPPRRRARLRARRRPDDVHGAGRPGHGQGPLVLRRARRPAAGRHRRSATWSPSDNDVLVLAERGRDGSSRPAASTASGAASRSSRCAGSATPPSW